MPNQASACSSSTRLGEYPLQYIPRSTNIKQRRQKEEIQRSYSPEKLSKQNGLSIDHNMSEKETEIDDDQRRSKKGTLSLRERERSLRLKKGRERAKQSWQIKGRNEKGRKYWERKSELLQWYVCMYV
ncbi:hypothetical protein V6Z11_D03G083600 [Gossypium hirsutum]